MINASALIATIIFHATGIAILMTLIVRLWHHFIEEVQNKTLIGKDMYHPLAKRDIEHYANLRNVLHTADYGHGTAHESWDEEKIKNQKTYLRNKRIFTYFRLLKHYIFWTFRLILPSYLYGYPSLTDNCRVIIKDHRFQPLRIAIMIWFIIFFFILSIVLINLR